MLQTSHVLYERLLWAAKGHDETDVETVAATSADAVAVNALTLVNMN